MMPSNATLYVYGGLTFEAVQYHIGGFIFGNRTVTGFWLSPWMEDRTEQEMGVWFKEVVTDLCTGGKIFGTTVAHKFKLEDHEKAFESSEKTATEGKTIFTPNAE